MINDNFSTVSSLLNSVSLVILQDFICPFKPQLTDKTATIISKVLVLILGGVAIVLVLFARYFGAGIMSVSCMTTNPFSKKYRTVL